MLVKSQLRCKWPLRVLIDNMVSIGEIEKYMCPNIATYLKYSRDGNILATGDTSGIIDLYSLSSNTHSIIDAHNEIREDFNESSAIISIEFLTSCGERASFLSSSEKTIKL